MKFTSLILSALLLAIALPAESRTWYVAADSTGDAPTLHAAMDSAQAGDVVLVGPGTYEFDWLAPPLNVRTSVTVTSEAGPLQTRVIGVGPQQPFRAFQLGDRAIVNGFWIQRFASAIRPGYDSEVTGNIVIASEDLLANTRCVVSYNLFAGYGVDLYFGNSVEFTHNIVLRALYCDGTPEVFSPCNNLVGLACPEFFDQLPNLNFSLDPMFCGEEGSGNYFLQSDSPCAPGNDPFGGGCGQIGPLPVGCGTVPVEETSWGHVKAMYGSEE